MGPITVYIAPASSNGAGAVWTKLAESGLNSGVWAVTTLIANGGKHSLTLPSNLAAGDYLLRAEIVALHEADTDYTVNSARGAQFYPSCSQFTVTGSGTASPPGGFNFIGGYSPEDPGILFNIYGSYTSYLIPGPAVWDGASTGSSSTSATSIKAATTSAAPTTSAVVVAPPTTLVTVSTTSAVTSVVKPTTTAVVVVPTTTRVAISTKVATTAVVTKPTSTAIARPATTSATSVGGSVAKYYQCGGKLWNGATTCVSGCSCVRQNEYYFQCL